VLDNFQINKQLQWAASLLELLMAYNLLALNRYLELHRIP
jgi:hypothetical protein